MADKNFELKPFHRNISDEELLNDIRRVADKLGVIKLSSREYSNNGGKYTSGTIGVRFGGWNKALEKVGLTLVQSRRVSQEYLFKNIEEVWISLGQQPTYRDMKKSNSKYSAEYYKTKFGAWRKALEAFIVYINSNNNQNQEVVEEEIIQEIEKEFKHKTKRTPNERLKVQVLIRDGNKCRLCGTIVTGENLHFDHITPWSKGGETILENLQVLCSKHNLAKGNLM